MALSASIGGDITEAGERMGERGSRKGDNI